MSKYSKIKWYRFNVARNLRLLEGDELVEKCQFFIDDIVAKKLDKNGFFKLLIQDLESTIAEAKTKKKQKGREFDPFFIPRSGDGRVALFGLSNVGKSTLMNAITNTDVKTGDYLHTTRKALAGTLEFKTVRIQIVDLPGFLDFKEEWVVSRQIVRVARTCDAILMVIDLSMSIDRQYDFLVEQLETAGVIQDGESRYKLGIIATKGDLPGSKERYTYLKSRTSYPTFPVSVNNPESLEGLKNALFDFIEVIRIYAKPPRSKPDLSTPFVVSEGSTIQDIAERIHKDFVRLFRYAKVWGPSVEFPGQQVGLEHELQDTDVVELTVNRR